MTDDVLGVALVLGCFVAPIAAGAIAAGGQLAEETERGHEVWLTQKR